MDAALAAIRARGALWGILVEVLSFPGDALCLEVRSGKLARRIESAQGSLPYTMDVPPALLREDLGPAALNDAFIHLFDAPAKGRACPLYAGVYAPNRRDAMEEIVRFYRHFGLTSAHSRDLPDNVPIMFEFLLLLAEAEGRAGGTEQVVALQRAERDVLDRHLRRWAANTLDRVADREVHPFYLGALELAATVITAEASYLGSLTAGAAYSPSR